MAAPDFIKINRTDAAATESGELLTLKNLAQQVYEYANRVRNKMKHNADMSVAAGSIVWGQVETLYGIPAGGTSTGTTANGAKVFSFVDGLANSADGTAQGSYFKDFIAAVG